GFIGQNMADDFVERGYQVVRYAKEEPYKNNLGELKKCQLVFIAVPTPTKPTGFDSSILEEVLGLLEAGTKVVIKSTILPGTTTRLQKVFPALVLMHSPEFLREKTAAHDARNPERNIIGIPDFDEVHETAAEFVLEVLPEAKYSKVIKVEEAELIKYVGNNFLTLKVVFMNLVYDLCVEAGADYEVVREAIGADSRIGISHTNVVDKSGHPDAKPGRGAGGHCFPKDLAAFREIYEKTCPDKKIAIELLRNIEKINCSLLKESDKDLDIITSIYG
ncbi:UDP-glucose/GDP-mannose dehydrogenase family protein, partial [Candidatus Kaiserbacteria bacterium]|nr:UDP-glucose/GDP-mannose dehydrogenase family protein [Candidatus Kaiserbacteria bacterium]